MKTPYVSPSVETEGEPVGYLARRNKVHQCEYGHIPAKTSLETRRVKFK